MTIVPDSKQTIREFGNLRSFGGGSGRIEKNNNYDKYYNTNNKTKNKLHSGTVIIILVSIIITMIIISNTVIILPAVSLAQVNSIPVNPFETRGIPPQIVMEYAGKDYPGKLVRYITNTSTSSNNSSTAGSTSQSLGGGSSTATTSSDNITSPLPNQIITVKKNSSVNFIVKGNNNISTKSQPNTLSVTAYDIKGTPVKLLNTTQQAGTSMVVVNLEKGQYILLSVATWLPQNGSSSNNINNNKNTIIGFVSYSYRINVVS